ncbi:MAG TPA: helix-turn-helix transcriptional regulator [Nocardioidaceae bacterium]|nr:helix-turn-helix transcriptional regulator [Nocardioidaceae bacterium]
MNADGDLPARVKAERKSRRWTQKELAKKAGMSVRAYQMFENRQSTPQGDNLRAILRAVDMDDSAEAAAEATREEWPRDIRVFLDMMGAFLATMTEEERVQFMRSETRKIFESRNG